MKHTSKTRIKKLIAFALLICLSVPALSSCVRNAPADSQTDARLLPTPNGGIAIQVTVDPEFLDSYDDPFFTFPEDGIQPLETLAPEASEAYAFDGAVLTGHGFSFTVPQTYRNMSCHTITMKR